MPNEGWCNLYPDKMPSSWHRSRALADRMSGKHRIAIIHMVRTADNRYNYTVINLTSEEQNEAIERSYLKE